MHYIVIFRGRGRFAPGNYAGFALFLVITILLTNKSYYFNYEHVVGASLLKVYRVV